MSRRGLSARHAVPLLFAAITAFFVAQFAFAALSAWAAARPQGHACTYDTGSGPIASGEDQIDGGLVPRHHCVGSWFDQRSSSIRDLFVPLAALAVGIVVWVVVRRRLLARQ
jgi:hypothetical protein